MGVGVLGEMEDRVRVGGEGDLLLPPLPSHNPLRGLHIHRVQKGITVEGLL